MNNDLIGLTDKLTIDPRGVDFLTIKLKDGTSIRSDRLVFVEGAIDMIRDTRPIYSGLPGEDRILMGYLPPLATGEVNLRFRLLADTGGNILTFSKPLPWWQRVVWKVGYVLGYALGLLSKPENRKFDGGLIEPKFKDHSAFDWEEWTP